MSDKFLEDIIGEWVELAAHACRTVSTDELWGDWQSYDWHLDLDVVDFLHGGTEIHYLIPGHKSRSRIIVDNIRPSGIVRNEQVTELPQGSPKTVDGATIEVENWDSPAPLPFHYNADIEEASGKNKSEALAIGFTESVEFSFGFAPGSGLGLQRQSRASSSGSRPGKTKRCHLGRTRVSASCAVPGLIRSVPRAVTSNITSHVPPSRASFGAPETPSSISDSRSASMGMGIGERSTENTTTTGICSGRVSPISWQRSRARAGETSPRRSTSERTRRRRGSSAVLRRPCRADRTVPRRQCSTAGPDSGREPSSSAGQTRTS